MSFNSKYIFPGDDKNEILSKINSNFAQIYFNAIGSPGPLGEFGPTGMIGPVGLDGLPGVTGSPAARWFFSPEPPLSAESSTDDIWVDIGITGFQSVYFYDGTNWVDTGESILQDSEFEAIIGVSGPGGSTTHNSIVFPGPSASDYSLVISDAVGTTANANPNFSKLMVSTAPVVDIRVGSFLAGGIVFYVNPAGDGGLVCAPSNLNATYAWGCAGTNISGTSSSLGTGAANTNLILFGCATRPIAASVCADLSLNGFSDWYLPSYDEMFLMYQELQPLDPASFAGSFWTSTQLNAGQASVLNFGTFGFLNKSNLRLVRPVRTFTLNDIGTVQYPILGFDKTFVGSASIPSFNWTVPTAESYDITFSNPGETRILLGTTGSFSATGGSGESMILAGNTFVQLTSQNQITFESSTGATGSLTLATPSTILMSSANKILTSNSLSYQNLADSSGLTADASTLIDVSGNQGLNIQILGSTTGTPIYTFRNPAGYRILESRSNNLTMIGETGPSGSASGCLVKKIDVVNSYSLNGRSGSQFSANGFLNNYASLEINGDNSDVICIKAYYAYLLILDANTPTANGEYYSIYLQLSGFQNITTVDPVNPGMGSSFSNTSRRIFDIFLEDESGLWPSGYISFGGIRTVYAGGSSSVSISNSSFRCYHIRLIFVNNEYIFYQFNYSGTANRCGYIPYVYTNPVSGGGGIGS